jgi:hypothetical protein
MTDDEFEEFAEWVNDLVKRSKSRPLSYVILIVPDRADDEEGKADSLAVYGTRDATDEQRHGLIDALDMLLVKMNDDCPPSTPNESRN